MQWARGLGLSLVGLALALASGCQLIVDFDRSRIQDAGPDLGVESDLGGPDLGPRACGDGVLEASEECDDGNQDPGDGCDATCAVEDGWTCSGVPSTCTEVCGDGRVVGDEACDDGFTDACGTCNADCSGDGTPSTCGDRELCPETEPCEDGNAVDLDGCSALCVEEPGWSCVTDSANDPPSACTSMCGDGALAAGAEVCDDGNTGPEDGCSGTCMVESGWSCTDVPGARSVCAPICGDGERVGAEALATGCDDGATEDGDGCSAACLVEMGWLCAGAPSACSEDCGDGMLVGVETGPDGCDDGGTVVGDGCNGTCMVETGWSCSGAPSDCAPICGDGRLRGAELCDDGNQEVCGQCRSASCASAPVAAAPAMGSLTLTAVPADGETFTLNDGGTDGAPPTVVTFELDTDGAVAGGNVAVDLSSASVIADALDAMESAVDAAADLNLEATVEVAMDRVSLVNLEDGVAGNQAVIETSAVMTATDMTGGEARDCPAGTGCGDDDDCASGSCVAEVCEP
ncbi:MAG: DUF4215 domain-containing protein [Sandaracinaceae bacterium]